MSTLALRLLGPPRAEINGSLVTIKRRKPLALLVYLAVTSARHSRDSLTELLYPGHDRERAFADFRQCLYILRAAMGENWLQVEQDGVALVDGQELWVRRPRAEATLRASGDCGALGGQRRLPGRARQCRGAVSGRVSLGVLPS